jgi:hypothetical protein
MVEEFFLPHISRELKLTRHSLTRPLLPCLNERWQRFRIQFRSTKEMHMVRHDDVTPDCPAMPIVRISPFIGQNLCNFL